MDNPANDNEVRRGARARAVMKDLKRIKLPTVVDALRKRTPGMNYTGEETILGPQVYRQAARLVGVKIFPTLGIATSDLIGGIL